MKSGMLGKGEGNSDGMQPRSSAGSNLILTELPTTSFHSSPQPLRMAFAWLQASFIAMSAYSSRTSCPFESLGHGRARPDVSICHLLGEDCCPDNRPTRSCTCPRSLCTGPLRHHTAVRECNAKSVTRFLAFTC